MKTKHYHNTNSVDPVTERLEAKKNLRQEDIIYSLFSLSGTTEFTASKIYNIYNSIDKGSLSKILGKKINEHYQVPLSSIRRGISNLKKQGYLKKTNETKIGIYGKPEHIYTLSQTKI